MVHVSTMLAALGCLLPYSSFLFVSGSPVNTLAVPSEQIKGSGLPDGYKLTPINWRGTLEEGKPLVYLSGDSFEDIEKQAKALNPAYTIFSEPAKPESRAHVNDTRLDTRQTTAVHCGWPGWGYASYSPVIDGVNYLRSITGDCRANAGPGSCGRVSCSYNSAIFYCNDNNVEHWEPCRWIGDVAYDISQSCQYFTGSGLWYVQGQAFDYRNWNTIVAYESC